MIALPINRKITIFCIMLLFILLMYKMNKLFEDQLHEAIIIKIPTNISCFHEAKSLNTLQDISEIEPKKRKTIFFHETSCKSFSKGKIFITARQACAVESAAKLNPNFDVYLLYSSPGLIKFEGDESDSFLKALKSYENIKIMHVDYANYSKGSPVEKLYSSKLIDQSSFPVEHASDIIRYLTLWKYGGIYLDLDVVVLKSMEELKLNFAVIQELPVIAAGILSFTPDGNGHKWAEMCLKDLEVSYKGNEWSNSSTGVITRLIQTICNIISKEINCEEYTVYPSHLFYPVPFNDWRKYFNEIYLSEVQDLVKDSISIHMWNALSKNTLIPVKEVNVPYLYFAKKFCPKVVAECREYF